MKRWYLLLKCLPLMAFSVWSKTLGFVWIFTSSPFSLFSNFFGGIFQKEKIQTNSFVFSSSSSSSNFFHFFSLLVFFLILFLDDFIVKSLFENKMKTMDHTKSRSFDFFYFCNYFWRFLQFLNFNFKFQKCVI